MLDFKEFTPLSNGSFYDTQEGDEETSDETDEEENEQQEEAEDEGEAEETAKNDEPNILLREPFKPYYENGQKYMDTICPFCGYKEKMVLE